MASCEADGWTSERLTAAQIIWGEHCLSPRGDTQLRDIAHDLTLRPHSHVLHIGAELGGVAKLIHRGVGCKVIAADTRQSITKASDGHVIHLQPRDSALATSLDLVLVDNIAEHSEQLATIIGNQSAGLAVGGALIVRSLVLASEHTATSEPYQAWTRLEPSRPCLRSEAALKRILQDAGLVVQSSTTFADDYAADVEQHWSEALDRIRTFHRDPATRPVIPVLQVEGERWLKRLDLIREGALEVRQIVAVRGDRLAA